MKELRSTIALRLTVWLLLLSLLPFFVMVIFLQRNIPLMFNKLMGAQERAHATVLALTDALDNDPAVLQEQLSHFQETRDTYGFVVDPQGRYLYHPNPAKEGASATEDFSSETIAMILETKEGEVEDRQTGNILGFHALADGGAVVIAMEPTMMERELVNLQRGSFIQLAVSLLLIALGGGAAIWITVGQPLRKLTRAAEQMAEGNLDARVDPEEMEDELSILGKTFNQMAVTMRSLISGLETNVADLIQTTSALEVSERRFRMIFNSVNDAISLRDIETGRIIEANDRMCEMYGFSREELMNSKIGELSAGEGSYTGEEGWNLIRKAVAEGPQSVSWQARRKDGSLFWVEINLTRVRVGEDDRILVVARDVTARKEAEQKIQEMNAQLEQRVQERTAELVAANRELEAFTYSVSHDLRAPLRAMDGFSRILLEDYGPQAPEEANNYLKSIRRNAQHMGRLIDDLLSLSRLGRKPLNKQWLDVGEIVEQALQTLEDDRLGRDIEMKIGEMGKCRGDELLLQQVWVNLLANALKFTRSCHPAVIEVGKVDETDRTVYFIRDNGVGFDMAYADKLFGVFQRLHRNEEFEGTGVGLAIVKRIIQRHGGDIWAEAQAGKGAVFYFTL
ncbi:MAG: PAS domain S-box protein [Anaerolineaceae bacterium]|nr:PAS domain S-box protein [Anaerolineaceae bacterium]